MPEMGKEADVNCRNTTALRLARCNRKTAESRINAFAYNPREMCET